jgi:magnesium-transporting ATPase (P-type)
MKLKIANTSSTKTCSMKNQKAHLVSTPISTLKNSYSYQNTPKLLNCDFLRFIKGGRLLSGEESTEISIEEPAVIKKEKIIRRFTTHAMQEEMRSFTFGEILEPRIQKQKRFSSNLISTAKYNLLTFLPLNLFQQVIKYANLYFFFFAALQMIKEISNSNGQPTLLLPLGFVILVSMVKDFLEDFKRQRSDKQENCNTVLVADMQTKQFIPKCWKDLKVGQTVKVRFLTLKKM